MSVADQLPYETESSGNALFIETKFAEGAKVSGAQARPAEDRIHFWPATWSTRDVCEGEEARWLYLVRVEGRGAPGFVVCRPANPRDGEAYTISILAVPPTTLRV
jgi:hypothetical protein